ncbi:MFS transporter [Roseibium sp. RKSG952]|uniref:MFS transporter n=1 Tax=Roseibium sp. RKSG952 TaxID=2529384 RepID=UPI0012BBEED2|nr:MFS transporter [Roseibium sp. RKSG952]MTH95677.1 MFS transporter [Roseibium sp. RKSG952]
MSGLAKITLLSVVFVDLLGQGLAFPIINSLIMDSNSPLLASGTPVSLRHFYFGLTIGVFFLCWFFGAPYISRISDVIGRKKAILICLVGAVAGYVITIIALDIGSLSLLILGRAITGFTAGNQPIAQAAMIDGSNSDRERNRNMGLIITGFSLGLIGGPLIAGLTSTPLVLGPLGTIKMPFYVALGLCVLTILMVAVYFKESRETESTFVFRPSEIVGQILRVKDYPIALRLTIGLFFFHVTAVIMYVFVDNYLSTRFGFGTFGSSMAFLVIGAAQALAGTWCVVPAQRYLAKEKIVVTTMVLFAASTLAFVAAPTPAWSFLPIFIFFFAFGIGYPTVLGLFAASVSADEQGWVMGVTVAVFTLIAGVMSVAGGILIDIALRLPFYIATAAAIGMIAVVRTVWQVPEMKNITGSAVDLPRQTAEQKD